VCCGKRACLLSGHVVIPVLELSASSIGAADGILESSKCDTLLLETWTKA